MFLRKKLISLFFPILTTAIFCIGLEWESPENYLSPAHNLTNIFAIPKDKRPTGKGVRVGIIDTGIDFTHPALGGCFGENCRVQFGKAFETADDFLPTHLRGTPYDDEGHGTKIAGIIGGNGENILGVAPDVIFGAYKISNSTTSLPSTFLDGINMAIEDKMDIIVICVKYPSFDILSDLLPNFDDTIVIVSAGNKGSHFSEMSLDPIANRDDVVTVASMTSDYYDVNQIEISSKTKSVIVSLTYLFVFPEKPDELTDKIWILLEQVDPSNENGCEVATYSSLEGKVVLVNYDECPIQSKVENLKHSNVSGVIVYTKDNYDFDFDSSYLPPIPVGGIKKFPKELKEILKSPYYKGKIPKQLISNKYMNQISTFSSWGPSKNIELKPEIAAPGDYVTTTAPLNRGKYQSVQGTSISAPYIAGLAALYLEANPNASPKDFSQALMNSATPLRSISGRVESVARQGAGVANGYGLLMNKVKVSPYMISIGVIKKTQSVTLTIMNTDERPKLFRISHIRSKLLNWPSIWATDENVNVSFSPSLEQYRIETFIEIQVTFSTQNEEKLYSIDYASGFIYLEEVSVSTGTSSMTGEKIHIPYLGQLNVNSFVAVETNVTSLFDDASIWDKTNSKFYNGSNENLMISTDFLNYFFSANFTLPLNQLTLDLIDGSISREFVKQLRLEREVPSGFKVVPLKFVENRIPKNIKSFRIRVTAEKYNLKEEWMSPLLIRTSSPIEFESLLNSIN